MKAKKRGRPPKPKGEALTEELKFRVRRLEKIAYEKVAKAASKDVSAWMREGLNSLAGVK